METQPTVHDSKNDWLPQKLGSHNKTNWLKWLVVFQRLKSQVKRDQPLGLELALTARAVTFQFPQVTASEHTELRANNQHGKSSNESLPLGINHCRCQGQRLR